jgi:hypothetical protein
MSEVDFYFKALAIRVFREIRVFLLLFFGNSSTLPLFSRQVVAACS